MLFKMYSYHRCNTIDYLLIYKLRSIKYVGLFDSPTRMCAASDGSKEKRLQNSVNPDKLSNNLTTAKHRYVYAIFRVI